MFWSTTKFIGYKEGEDKLLLNYFSMGTHEVHILYQNDKYLNFKIVYYE